MSKLKRRTEAVIVLAVLGAVIAGLIGTYQKWFTQSVDVTVESDRAGLLLDQGADVRAFGVPVGQVRTITQKDGKVLLDVALDPDSVDLIPANVSSTIDSTTVFGAKFVNLHVPRGTVGEHVQAGDVIRNSSTTVEVSDVFDTAMRVIEAADPVALNTTLSNMANGLNGRGEKLGELIDVSTAYLDTFDSSLDNLGTDFKRGSEVIDLYADVAPRLISSADNLSTTSRTLREKRKDIRETLTDLREAAAITDALLVAVEGPLGSALGVLRPVFDLLERMAPAVTCSVVDLDLVQAALVRIQGAAYPGIQMSTGFLPAQSAYKTDTNLPKFLTGVGPVCPKLPDEVNTHPVHYNFDDGTKDTYTNTQGPDLTTSPIGVYQDALRDYFGDAGATQLLNQLLGQAP